MPVFGTVKDGVILATQVKTPFDCLILGEMNSGDPPAYAAGPCWLFEGGRLEYSRRADYTAIRGSYDALAKWYRADLRAVGRCRTLEEKAEGHPLVHTLPGAALAEMHVNYTGKPGKGRTPKELVDTAHSMGFDRLVSYAVGVWQRPFQGDDNPVPPDQGTMEALAEGARYARSVSDTYYLSVYENFVDRYSITPGFNKDMMVKLRDGSVRLNWWWEALKERSSTVCSVKREEIARRELGNLKDLIGPGSIYVDVEGAIELLECFDPVHPTTRKQDAHHRFELLSYTRDLFGTVATESMPIDCLADAVDVGAYFPVYQWIGYGCSEKPRMDPAVIPVPLFVMTYHGSVLTMTPKQNNYYTCDSLYVPLWGMMADDTDEFSLAISRDMRETAYATLDEHAFLTPPKVETGKEYHSADVQMSRFSDGACVIANFSGEEFTWRGRSVPAKEYVLWRE